MIITTFTAMDQYLPHLIPGMPYRQILEMMFESYAREYGTRKIEKVAKKALTGSRIQKLLQHSMVHKHRISKEEILENLMGHPYFWMAKPRTVAVGALIVLNAWDEGINKKVNIYSANEMQHLASTMLAETLI